MEKEKRGEDACCHFRTILNKKTAFLRVAFLQNLLDILSGQSEYEAKMGIKNDTVNDTIVSFTVSVMALAVGFDTMQRT